VCDANWFPGIDEVLPKVTLHKPDVLVSSSQSYECQASEFHAYIW
jgi:hypothetical protein